MSGKTSHPPPLTRRAAADGFSPPSVKRPRSAALVRRWHRPVQPAESNLERRLGHRVGANLPLLLNAHIAGEGWQML